MTRRGSERDPRAARAGLTLLELLLVMSILGVVLGMGIGVFASIDPGRHAAVGALKSALRRAQNSALVRRAPAELRIDAEARTLVPVALEVLGTWHFEGEGLEGAFGLAGTSSGGRPVDDGYLGRALSFADEAAGAGVTVPVQDDPSFDFTQGFAIELCLRLERPATAHALRIGDVIGVHVTSAAALRAWFVPELESDEGERTPGEHVVLETGPGALATGRWARVRVAYDRRRLTVEVDGLLAAELAAEAPVWGPLLAPLVISGGRVPLPGAIDRLVLGAWSAGERAVLPDGVSFAPGTPAAVHYDAAGRLDRRAHSEPVVLELELADGERSVVRATRLGAVE